MVHAAPPPPTPPYDAVLVVSFGGPEAPEDVLPFLRNVTRGRNVPPERLAEVARHYQAVGGVSPINAQNRALVAALEAELAARGPALPVYWGNRNWHPMLPETIARMAQDGARRALAFVTSAYSSYSSCRQYREDIARARAEVGAGAPVVDKLRLFYDHPGFIEPVAARVEEALRALPGDKGEGAHIAFTAHSIPAAMAACSEYEAQLREACRLVADRLGAPHPWELVFQSRSGPPSQPWLGPDVLDHLGALAASEAPAVALVPIGFVSDHMEVVHDLDGEAMARAAELGMPAVRAATVGTDPAFVSMIRELVVERLEPGAHRRALGCRGPRDDLCGAGCCPPPGMRTGDVPA